MNKITVFWIEDNPIQDNIDDDGLPDFPHQEIFDFHLFQHPTEVKEYLKMINKLSQGDKYSDLAEVCPSALPDIVVFDYKLSDNFSTRHQYALQYNQSNHHSFLTDKSASKKLKTHFEDVFQNEILFLEREDVRTGNYKSDELKNELFADKIQNIDDEFGLYSGVAIVREFKDHITCGVPATVNKADKSAMTTNSLFYEWLNGYDIKDAIERTDKEIKNWDDILVFATRLLRNRVVDLIKSRKIIVNLQQLLAMAEGNISSRPEKRTLSFKSIYGRRVLPLDGLFVGVPEASRTSAITTFAKDCLELPLLNVNNGLTTEYLLSAMSFSEKLLSHYDENKIVLDRIRFSQLCQKRDEKNITEEQKVELKALSEKYGAENNNGKFKINVFDLRSFKGTNSNLIKRYAVLFVMVNVYKRYIEFCNKYMDNPEYKNRKHLFTVPDRLDYLLAIYPCPATPIILPLHNSSDTDLDKDLKRTTQLIVTYDEVKKNDKTTKKLIEDGLSITEILNCQKNPKQGGISDGERFLLQSYASGLGMRKGDWAEWFS